jgi:hypothetical protein
VIVVVAFVATVWLSGPRAAAVLAAKFRNDAPSGPTVTLDRVGFVERPAWMSDEMLVAVAETLSPWLSDEVGILDEPTARKLRDGLLSTPWVREVRLERAFPDRFRLDLSLRRPRIEVRAGDDRPLCLVDDDGVMLPWMAADVPMVRLYAEGGAVTMDVQPGQRCSERRVLVAAAVAAEWRDHVAAEVAGCPRLVEVDATNIGEQWIRGVLYPEVRVLLARGDGALVNFAYGRPVDSPLPRVPTRTKATVLKKVLRQHPALQGLTAGDLRLARRWADYLQPRAPTVADPVEPWTVLDAELLPQADARGR